MIIPIEEIAPETLRNVVESVVLREGTDYGESEVEFTTKVEQVLQQLRTGEAQLQYSELHDSVDIIKKRN
ncbi:YheU family protein [Alteromonas flava]|uniref:YheU family protein n=1 Tax=Alteromonas flava TaxID=2048003 RepID=UPI000C292705|nr:YheU family protein [Alteromonas flava]